MREGMEKKEGSAYIHVYALPGHQIYQWDVLGLRWRFCCALWERCLSSVCKSVL